MRTEILSIVVACLLLPLTANGQSKWEFNGYNPGVGLGQPLPAEEDSAFYRSFAKPVRDKAQRRAEGGDWVLETDRQTRISYPRVVRLSQGRSDATINAALSALHGQRIRWARETDSTLATNLKYLTDRASVPPRIAVEPGGSTTQTAARITYFSRTTVSVVDTAYVSMVLTSGWASARGVMIDIASGTIFDVRVCDPARKRPTFTFGPLLTICTEEALSKFFDLWAANSEKARAEIPKGPRAEDLARYCKDSSHIYSEARFTLYLTDAGLAVHDLVSIGSGPTMCIADPNNPYNPVVIPYRELAPLMTPGPLRDELLARH